MDLEEDIPANHLVLEHAVKRLEAQHVQIGTENQFIVGYSLHQRPSDTRHLKPHLEKVKALLGALPGTVIADAGYGGEENYAYLEAEQVEAIVKIRYVRAAGRTLSFVKTSKERTEGGYEIQYRHYRSTHCGKCPLKPKCTKAEGNREVRVSLRYIHYKQQVKHCNRTIRQVGQG